MKLLKRELSTVSNRTQKQSFIEPEAWDKTYYSTRISEKRGSISMRWDGYKHTYLAEERCKLTQFSQKTAVANGEML